MSSHLIPVFFFFASTTLMQRKIKLKVFILFKKNKIKTSFVHSFALEFNKQQRVK